MEATGIILAGGKSSRLGRNKAAELIGGIPLIERVINSLKPITNRILQVTAQNSDCSPAVAAIEMIEDIYPGRGPLGGIYTGLCSSRTVANIVVGCDMPFLNTSLLEHMTKLLSSYDAIVPRWPNGRIEPLHAVYSISCIPMIKRHLDNDQLSIGGCLKKMHVLHLNKRGFSNFDPEFLSFFNINTKEDVAFANKVATAQSLMSPSGHSSG